MAYTRPQTLPEYVRRVLPAALIAVAATLGGITFGYPAIAHTAPNDPELDVGAYDDCYKKGLGQGLDEEEFFNHAAGCCAEAGGTWSEAQFDCQAPPAEPAELRPGMLPPGGIIQTFTPVPAPSTLVPPTSVPAPNTRG